MSKSLHFSWFLEFRQTVANKFLWLLIPLTGLIFLPSFIHSTIYKDILIYTCLGLVLFIGVFLLAETRQKLKFALTLASITLIINLIPFAPSIPLLFLLRMICLLSFFLWLLFFVFRQMAKARKISENIIFGAVNGYLLLGLIGGFCFRLIHFFNPAAFSIHHPLAAKLDVFTYFSFVTLTNLGYGDITPIAPSSQSMTLFLAISGQLYLAIVIGILVGKFVGSRTAD